LSWLGLPARDDSLEFPLTVEDHTEADRVARHAGLDCRRTVFMHPGARLPSRRWPAERFAAVANQLGQDGWHIAVTGSADEAALTRDVLDRLYVPATDLCAATSLGALASLLSRGRLLVC